MTGVRLVFSFSRNTVHVKYLLQFYIMGVHLFEDLLYCGIT